MLLSDCYASLPTRSRPRSSAASPWTRAKCARLAVLDAILMVRTAIARMTPRVVLVGFGGNRHLDCQIRVRAFTAAIANTEPPLVPPIVRSENWSTRFKCSCSANASTPRYWANSTLMRRARTAVHLAEPISICVGDSDLSGPSVRAPSRNTSVLSTRRSGE